MALSQGGQEGHEDQDVDVVQLAMMSNGQSQGQTAIAPVVAGDRYARWAYCIFAFAVGTYTFVSWILWLYLAVVVDNGALFFFCGMIPSILTFVWILVDSTAHCHNLGSRDVAYTCCCHCANPWVMTVPMAIASGLRCILWLSLFWIWNDLMNVTHFLEDMQHRDNMCWLIVSVGSVDVGPMILLTIDYWWYYGKRDYNALLGTRIYPLRCM